MIGVLVRRVPLYSHPIDILGVQTVCLEEDCKKRISKRFKGCKGLYCKGCSR